MKNRIKALYESVGRGFESLPSHQEKPVHIVYWFFFLSTRWKGLEQGGGAQRRKQSHSAALLSLRVPTRRNVYRGSCNRKISWLFCFVSHGCTVFARSVLSMSDDVGRCIALQSVPFFCFCELSGCGSGERPCPLGFALPGCAPLRRCRKFSPVELPKIRPESST